MPPPSVDVLPWHFTALELSCCLRHDCDDPRKYVYLSEARYILRMYHALTRTGSGIMVPKSTDLYLNADIAPLHDSLRSVLRKCEKTRLFRAALVRDSVYIVCVTYYIPNYVIEPGFTMRTV